MTASALHADAPGRGPHKAYIREASQILILDAAESVFARNGFGGATMAAIAEAAGVPKANLHYYFRTKEQLYRAVLDRTLDLWLAETDPIVEDADPAEALASYIRAKMRLSHERPDASRVFANEVLHGAAQIEGYLNGRLRRLVADKARVIEGWIARGLMDPIDPRHLFFMLWAATQTYADFDVQVRAVLGVKRVSATEHERATQQLVRIVLQGLGVRTL